METYFEDTNDFALTAKSSVKLIKNSKGVNWEINVVVGEESLMDDLKKEALKIHNELVKELPPKLEVTV